MDLGLTGIRVFTMADFVHFYDPYNKSHGKFINVKDVKDVKDTKISAAPQMDINY